MLTEEVGVPFKPARRNDHAAFGLIERSRIATELPIPNLVLDCEQDDWSTSMLFTRCSR